MVFKEQGCILNEKYTIFGFEIYMSRVPLGA